LDNYKENKATTSEELDAVLMYLDKLKPQCESKVMSYAEKTTPTLDFPRRSLCEAQTNRASVPRLTSPNRAHKR
jgi:hypothetical protein